MVRFIKPLMWLSVILVIKTSVFLLLAAAGTTPLPPAILLGLAATWLTLALWINWIARRLNSRVQGAEKLRQSGGQPDLAR